MMKMLKQSWKSAMGSIKEVFWNLVLITLGSWLCAVAINGILIPQHFVSGGVVGLALVIHYLFSSLSVSLLYFVLNIPLFVLGWMYVGRRFFVYSMAGLFIFSGAVAWTHLSVPVHDMLLSALLAGIITGVGSGIILRSLGSAGGLDILSIIILKRFSIRLGSTIVTFNALILVAAAVFFTLDMALYTLIFMYVSSSMINLVVTGLSQRKAVHIVSPHWERISQDIMEQLQRGVTILGGRGGYSGREQQILYAVVTFRELPRLKQLVNAIDPNAFVVVSDTLEVIGQRIGNQPHW
jgi:uncharacterized membrane-anchored protein YitT (DUF2179 family)